MGIDAGTTTPPDTPPPGTPPPGTPPPGSMECESTTPIEFEMGGSPDLLLVIDGSGSMLDPLSPMFDPSDPLGSLFAEREKWAIMDEALRSLVDTYDDRLNLGATIYPIDEYCGVGPIRAECLPNNASTVKSILDSDRPTVPDTRFTPTHLALDGARNYFTSRAVNPDGRYVLLATDGIPNCADEPSTPSADESVAAVAALAAEGIPTYVVGFGDIAADVSDRGVLQRMATAGATGHSFFEARSPETLNAAFESIAAELIPPPCQIALSGPPRDPALLRVSFDRVLVPRDPEPRQRLGLRRGDEQRVVLRRPLRPVPIGERRERAHRLWLPRPTDLSPPI